METKEQSKNVHKGHRQRLRELLNKPDLTTFSEHQILELMLSFVIPQKDVNPLAHNLLNEFGNLANVLDSSIENLKKINGIGEVTASFLNFCSKIPEIYKKSKISNNIILTSPTSIIKFFLSTVDFGSIENFYFICLGHTGNLLCLKKLGTGNNSKVYIDKRDFIMQVLKYPTCSVVLCHTHPNGGPEPSNEDISFTSNIINILEPLSINVCDHIIISPKGEFSFFRQGLIDKNKKEDKLTNIKSESVSNSKFTYQ